MLAGLTLGCLHSEDPKDATRANRVVERYSQSSVTPEQSARISVETAELKAEESVAATGVVAAPEAAGRVNDADDERRGGVLRVEFDRLFIPDPAIDGDESLVSSDAEIFSGLMRFSGRPDPLIEPDLASSFSVRDKGLTYEFVLRQDLKFSDGTPVTAYDFKWSWERALSLSDESRRVQDVLGDIRGAEKIVGGSSEDLVGLKVIDDRTLIVELERPRYGFVALLADPIASVLKRSNVENWGIDWSRWYESSATGTGRYAFGELPVGTGPFKMEEFDFLAGRMALLRNEHYWDRPAFVDRIEFIPLLTASGEELGDVASLMTTGRLDLTHHFGYTETPASEEYRVESYGDLERFPVSPTLEFLAFNTALEPYDNIHFRRALALAADIDSFTKAYSGSGDRLIDSSRPGASAFGIIPPGFPGFNAQEKRITHDLDAAVEEIEAYRDGGGVDPIKVRLVLNGFGTASWFSALTSQWEDFLNIEFEYDEVGIDTYENWLKSGKLQIMHKVVTARYAGPHAILGVFEGLFGANAASPEAEELQRMLGRVNTSVWICATLSAWKSQNLNTNA